MDGRRRDPRRGGRPGTASPRSGGATGRGGRSWSRRPSAGTGAGGGPPPARSAPRSAAKPAGPRSIVEEIRAISRPGQADRALRAFDQAVALLERDRAAAAVSAAMVAKDAAPRSGAVREVLGIALYTAGRFRDALRELQAYRRITDRADQNHLIADAHRALGAPRKALEEVRAGLRAHLPDEIRAELTVVGASALADMARSEEAIGMIRSFPTRERVVRPCDLRVWYVTGDILERSGRTAEAATEFRRVVRHDAAAFDAAERLARLDGGGG